MRRKDREICDNQQLFQIIDNCKICRVAMQDQDGIYIVPLNFGYVYRKERLTLYFHSAKEGRKLNAIMKESRVGFEMDCEHRLIEAENACSYGYAYQSIIGNGNAEIVDDCEERKRALAILMKHQTGKDFSFDDKMIANVAVFKINVTSFTGKVRK